jgi:hypothetical protein
MLLLGNSQGIGKVESHKMALGKPKTIKCHLMV